MKAKRLRDDMLWHLFYKNSFKQNTKCLQEQHEVVINEFLMFLLLLSLVL